MRGGPTKDSSDTTRYYTDCQKLATVSLHSMLLCMQPMAMVSLYLHVDIDYV